GHGLRALGHRRGSRRPGPGAADRHPVAAGHGAVAAGVVHLCAAVPVHPGGGQARNRFLEVGGGDGPLPVRPGLPGLLPDLPDHPLDHRLSDAMTTWWPLLENVVLALVVLAAALYSLKRVLPGTWRRGQVALALLLL